MQGAEKRQGKKERQMEGEKGRKQRRNISSKGRLRKDKRCQREKNMLMLSHFLTLKEELFTFP